MKKTSNALQILDQITGDDPELRGQIEQEHQNLDIAHQIADLRKAAGLSQAALAAKVGTSQSAISRLEDADYDGHSLSMLRKIANVLGAGVEVRLVQSGARRRPTRRPLQPA
jgi:ribosome-binding protein aMBF1 (putative translation factor)